MATAAKPIVSDHEGRRERRTPTSFVGTIRLPNGDDISCIVKDASKSGLRLGIPPSYELARTFFVKVAERGVAMRVRLMWREGGYAGVAIEKIIKLDLKPE